MERCPANAWTVAKSAPDCMARVQKVWRSECGLILFLMPALLTYRRTQNLIVEVVIRRRPRTRGHLARKNIGASGWSKVSTILKYRSSAKINSGFLIKLLRCRPPLPQINRSTLLPSTFKSPRFRAQISARRMPVKTKRPSKQKSLKPINVRWSGWRSKRFLSSFVRYSLILYFIECFDYSISAFVL